jgi:hypothetical protein
LHRDVATYARYTYHAALCAGPTYGNPLSRSRWGQRAGPQANLLHSQGGVGDFKNDAAHILVSEEIVAGELQVVLVGPHATRFEPDARCDYARSLGSNLLDDGIDRYSIASQIDDDVAVRLRAANENVPVGRLVEWLRSIGDRSRHQIALTVVTNTRPARPADGHVARLGQLQNALVGRLPMCGAAAACERDQRTRVAVVRGQMRSSDPSTRYCAEGRRSPIVIGPSRSLRWDRSQAGALQEASSERTEVMTILRRRLCQPRH